jgi:predicted AlkP superfamily phosphohydrolase/phosphomutase
MWLGYIDPGTGYTIFTLGGGAIAMILAAAGAGLLFIKRIIRFFKKTPRSWRCLLIAVILMFTGGFFVRSLFPIPCPGKVIVLGFDALSPDIVEPLMSAGRLPNFSRLKALGSYSRLATTTPAQSPVAWAGFATGKNPGKHGIYEFIQRDPATYQLSLMLSSFENGKPRPVLKAPGFWHYTSRSHVPTVVLRCPLTFPPEKISGRMLSGMGVPDILGTEGTFSFYTTDPADSGRDTGGNVVVIPAQENVTTFLRGPKISGIAGTARNVAVPFHITRVENGRVHLAWQNTRLDLDAGQWSAWQPVNFPLGIGKSGRGIFKCYLVSTAPHLRLYVTPIEFDPRRPLFAISHPASYAARLVKILGLYHTRGMPLDTWGVNEGRLDESTLLRQCEEVLEQNSRLLEYELRHLRRGVLFAYFETADIIQHMFWRYNDAESPRYDPQAPAEYRRTIEQWYENMDALLGRVLPHIGPEDTLIVLSDHGFAAFRRAVNLNSWLRDNGYLELLPGYSGNTELLQGIDWPRTRAYAVGFGAVYLNLAGREKDGIVAPGKEAVALAQEISAKLRSWTDPKNKQPVVYAVYRKEDVFRGPFAELAPDLHVGFQAGYRASWQTALGAVPEPALEDNVKKWSGDHLIAPELVPGILFANRPLSGENPSLYDLAPTILHAAGVPLSAEELADFDGRSLFE